MRTRLIPVFTAVVVILAAFGVGVVAGSAGLIGVRVPTSTGDGMVGDQVVTLWAGDVAYGARSSVAWRDASGVQHLRGWPDCLATPGEVTNVRFTGAIVWHETMGAGTILWVDCGSR